MGKEARKKDPGAACGRPGSIRNTRKGITQGKGTRCLQYLDKVMRDRGGDLESVGFLKRVGTEQGESLHVVKRNEKKKKKDDADFRAAKTQRSEQVN